MLHQIIRMDLSTFTHKVWKFKVQCLCVKKNICVKSICYSSQLEAIFYFFIFWYMNYYIKLLVCFLKKRFITQGIQIDIFYFRIVYIKMYFHSYNYYLLYIFVHQLSYIIIFYYEALFWMNILIRNSQLEAIFCLLFCTGNLTA